MKKLSIFVSLAVAAVVFTGCGSSGGGGGGYVPPPSNATTLFLIDQDGFSLGGVPYICDSMVDWSATRPNGEFTFFPPDNCTFDFAGYNGNYDNDPLVDDIIYIVDDLDRGKSGIEYDCDSFGASTTYYDGSFDYDANDICTFYF